MKWPRHAGARGHFISDYPDAMRAVIATEPGGPEVLTLRDDVPDPEVGPGEVLVRIIATAVNKADTLQRMGFYAPPPGASDVIGLECTGTVEALGDEVCALLAGGGYAELVAVPAGQLMPLPKGVDPVTAAALPEVAATVWSNVFMVAGLQPGETFLVHGGSGGIGTFAIQLASALGARVATTAGTEEKLAVCRELGAEIAVNYREQDFVEVLKEAGGADVILDNMGAKYLAGNVDALAMEGRLVIIGMQGGSRAELDINMLLRKRGAVIATTLRARPEAEKAAICAAVVEHVWPLVEDGRVRPVVHTTMPLAEAAEAHRLMDASTHIGKIVLTA
jgi:putative PIG3 family NAD(P)H quinone oxidoreductase